MPVQDQKTPHAQISEIMRKMFEQPINNDLAHEISELRREIAELRADLAPVPSLILTGRAALDEFKKLSIGV